MNFDQREDALVGELRRLNQRMSWMERQPLPVVPTATSATYRPFAASVTEADIPADLPVGAVYYAMDTGQVIIQEATGRTTMSLADYLAP